MQQHAHIGDEALQLEARLQCCHALHIQQIGVLENLCSKINEYGMSGSNKNSREESASNAARRRQLRDPGNPADRSDNTFHVCEGGLVCDSIYFETVACDTSIPNFSSSPWILGAPQPILVACISRISLRRAASMAGRPGLGPLLFQRQYWR